MANGSSSSSSSSTSGSTSKNSSSSSSSSRRGDQSAIRRRRKKNVTYESLWDRAKKFDSEPMEDHEQKELVDDFNVLLRRQNRQIRISGAVLILFFAATFFALDFWTPHKWRPDVEEHVRDISAFQQIVEATCYGASDGLYEKQSVLMLVILNLLSTSLILWKGGLGKASMLCVPCLTLLYYLGHFLLVGLDTRTTCTPMLPIFTVGIHAMWIWLIGDEAVLRGHLDKLDAARYEHKSA